MSAFVGTWCNYEEKDPLEDASPFPRAGALELVYLASFCGASHSEFLLYQHARGLVTVFQQNLVNFTALKGKVAAVTGFHHQ